MEAIVSILVLIAFVAVIFFLVKKGRDERESGRSGDARRGQDSDVTSK